MKSQLRQDLVSGDWILIAPGRAKRPVFGEARHYGRPRQLLKTEKRKVSPKASCPFEDPQKSGHEKPILVYGDLKNWRVQVVENKYPALIHKDICAAILKKGPYSVTEGIGHHDLIISRDHNKNFARLSKNDARQVFEAFRDRYLMLLNDKCLAYTLILHNWGARAGASVHHPHYQMVATPIVPPDVMHSLNGSSRYFQKNKKCVHCVMIDWEKKHKKRVVYENSGAIAFAPFVSKNAFEVRIFPKKHSSYFENTLDIEIDYVVDALQSVLRKLEKNLQDPDYNFFIHTAPIKDKAKYKMYHWHIEVAPKTNINAGFELGTGVEINEMDPDQAAALLRK